jgi:hypothetical protein
MKEETDAHELSDEQRARARREERMARTSEEDEEFVQHARRADKARYLQKKLEERKESESEK